MIRYFISDLHLSDERPDLIQAFITLVDYLILKNNTQKNNCTLFIVGDFYESWIGDDDHPQWKENVDAALSKLTNNNIELIFFHGNRDFLLDEKWAQRIGATLITDQLILRENKTNILISHGDEACLDDVEYQAFRTMVRDPKWKQNFLALPLPQRISITQELRAKSKEVKTEKALDIMDVNSDEITRLMSLNDCQLMIHGHTHRPNLHTEKSGHRIVLGDWHTHAWLGILEKGRFRQLKIKLTTLGPVNLTSDALAEMDHKITNSLITQAITLG